jgi:V/A-type H+-transporting ATPase subunit D
MAIKLTKNELKKQKDNLKQFQRYLPTLQLKKQQLQTVIMGIRAELERKKQEAREQVKKGIDTIEKLAEG